MQTRGIHMDKYPVELWELHSDYPLAPDKENCD